MQDVSSRKSFLQIVIEKKIQEYQRACAAEKSFEETRKIYQEYIALRHELDQLYRNRK